MEKTIKHLGFWYMVEVESLKRPGETHWIEKTATQGETVDIQRESDIARGEHAGAFYSKEEIKQGKHLPPEPESEPEENGADEVDSISEMSDGELVAWIKEDRPTARDMVDAAEGDADLARRLLSAEDEATGGNSRRNVIQGLTAVIQQGA